MACEPRTARRASARVLAAALAGLAVAVTQPAAAAGPEVAVTARLDRLGALIDAWEVYKLRHVDPSGRVIDGANDGISHSEGQGYGMLIAVKLADREAFDAIWSWTHANLAVRPDNLFAWRWEPGATEHVTDLNDATDGDILIAWALVEAAALWDEPRYLEAAHLIAADVARLAVADTKYGPVLLPAATGFSAADRPDGPIVNLSYFVFPARAALERAAPETDWDAIFAAGQKVLAQTPTLPPDWTALGRKRPVPAASFEPVFGYNAIRVPLYLAWAGNDAAPLERFAGLGDDPAVVDVATGARISHLSEPGFAAIGTLTRCALDPDGPHHPVVLGADGQNYYPDTLNLLAAIAQLEVYPSCLD